MGSDDKDNIKIHWLNKFFDARFVRFYPLSWYGENICMRVELYGCITGKQYIITGVVIMAFLCSFFKSVDY